MQKLVMRLSFLYVLCFLVLGCSKCQTMVGGTLNTSLTLYPTWQNGIQLYGNSITYGYNLPTPSTDNWAAQTATAKGISITNYAISGIGSRKAYSLFVTNCPINPTGAVATMFGFNDIRPSTNETAKTKHIMAAHRALCAVMWTKSIIFPYQGTTGTQGMTFTNSAGTGAGSEATLQDWGSRTYYYRHNDATNSGANYFNRTVSAGETISFSLTGTAIAIGTWGCDGTTTSMSRIQVSVDGTIATTYNPNGIAYAPDVQTYFTQDGIINDAIVLTGLSNASHSIILTFLDNARGAIDYAAVLKTPAEAAANYVWINDLPHMNTTGYTYSGGEVTQTTLDSVTTVRKANLQSTFPSYPFAFVDINAAGYYEPQTYGTQIQSDGIHPSKEGAGKIANRVLYYMK